MTISKNILSIINSAIRRFICLLSRLVGSLSVRRGMSSTVETRPAADSCRHKAPGCKKTFLISGIIIVLCLVVFIAAEGMGFYIISDKKTQWGNHTSGDVALEEKELKDLQKKNEKLLQKIKKLAPKDIYIVVDTAKNRLYLKKGNEITRTAVISTGSGNVLTEPGGNRSWVFDTPRGEFAVKYKLKDPAWIKPDWAYIEEGEDIPKVIGDRVEEDVLGEYAMGFGNGYFIHGTLYTRLLGRNVTHGCVRLGDEDLEAVNRASKVGTKIFIY